MSGVASDLISVLMPAYNAEMFIGDAIRSIISQDFQSWELIIVDDGSTDATYDRAKAFASDKIRVFRNDANKGVVYTRNKLFTLAKGNYIALLDADDSSLPGRLAKQYHFLESNPRCAFMATGAFYTGKSETVIAESLDEDNLKIALLFYNPVCNSSLLFNRSLIKEADLNYVDNGCFSEDYQLTCRLMQHYEGCVSSDILVNHRTHASSVSANKAAMTAGEIRGLQSLFDFADFQFTETEMAVWHCVFFKKEVDAMAVETICRIGERMLEYNRVSGFFRQDLFSKKLGEMLQLIFRRHILGAGRYSPELAQLFFHTPSFIRAGLKGLEVVKFLVKCGIRFNQTAS